MTKNIGWAALAAGLAAGPVALAQTVPGGNDPLELPELVVTADRVPTPIDQVGSAVTVITREELERRQTRFVTDILREVPGLSVVQTSGRGSVSEVRIRGAEFRHTLVLIDGIEVGDPTAPGGPLFDFGNLLAADVERIEIVRGPQSTLWGADAIGGVINIITRRGAPGFHPSASIEYGSYNTYEAQLGLTGGTEDVDVALNLARFETDGFSAADERDGNTEDDGARNTTFSAKVEARPADGLAFGLVYRHTDSYLEYDPGFPVLADGDVDVEGRYDSGRLYAQFATGAVNHEIDITGSLFRRDDSSFGGVEGHRVKLGYQGDWAINPDNRLVFGAEVDAQSMEAPTVADADQTALYLQLQTSPLDNLYLSIGGRFDRHSQYGDHTTYRATAAYDLPAWGTTLRGSVGTGFKAPALTDLFDQFGNPDLQPEESFGWDIGVDQDLFGGRIQLGATYFDSRVKDLIVFDLNTFSLANAGETRSRGVELSAGAAITPDLHLNLAYTYMDAENEQTGVQLARRPRHQGSLNVAWDATPAIHLDATAIYRADGVDNGGADLDDYVLVNLAASYDVTPNVSVFGRVENLFDEEYQELVGYGTAGLSGYAGVRARF